MNENLDLTKILEECPEGTKLYSSIFGEVVFICIDRESPSYPILIKVSFEPKWRNLTKQGKLYAAVGECTLFPSKEQRDWSKFTAPWYKKNNIVKNNVYVVFLRLCYMHNYKELKRYTSNFKFYFSIINKDSNIGTFKNFICYFIRKNIYFFPYLIISLKIKLINNYDYLLDI